MKMIAWVASALVALLAITMFVIPEVSPATEDSTTDVVSSVFIFLCTMLVFIMSPAIALFYGGMLRKQSMTSIIAQCIGVVAVSGVVWWAVGYSLALTGDGKPPPSNASLLEEMVRLPGIEPGSEAWEAPVLTAGLQSQCGHQ